MYLLTVTAQQSGNESLSKEESFTEEDLRSRLLLPYLQALSVGADQVLLERAFHLRLGRTTVEVKSRAARATVGGRLDILVRSLQGDNLFVVELKAPGEELTDEDRDQGISYARLLDQIAPFVLLTNGSDTRLFDTISTDQLRESEFPKNSAFWTSGRLLATTEDLRIRYEALRNFFGYSLGNVRAFSHAQQAIRMASVRGDATKKYVPELYVPRHEVRGAVNQFIAGKGVSLAIVGDSGVGKTNEMCALAEYLAENHITVFFSAGALHTSICDALLDEFNWQFSEQVVAPVLVRRLADLARHCGHPVVVMVDALDEASVAAFEQSTSDFAERLRTFHGLVKLIVSAKSGEWDRFATFRGDPSPLRLALDTSWHVANQDRPADSGPMLQRPLLLAPFSDRELADAVPRYTEFFSLSEAPQGELGEYCRVPFVLRVASEVYAGRERPLPNDISEAELLQAWLERKLGRMSNPERARRELEAVARAAYEQATSASEGPITPASLDRISEAKVREHAGLSSVESVAGELVSHGVLTRQTEADGLSQLAFYYGRFRDYMIARYVLRLDQMDPVQFGGVASTLLSNHVLQSVLFWHLRHASPAHRQVLHQILAGRAASFLETYERILDSLAPGVKPHIEPFTAGRLGIAYEVDPHGLRYYGFYPSGQATPDRVIELNPVYDGRPYPFSRDLWQLGGHTALGGGRNFTNAAPSEMAAELVLERVRKAVEAGGLDDTASEALVEESVLAITMDHRERLRLPWPQHELHLPIAWGSLDLRVAMERLQAYFGRRYYEDQWVREQIDQGTQFVRAVPGGSSVSISLDADALRPVGQRAEDEAVAGARFPAPNVMGQEDLKVLAELLELLLSRGEAVVQSVLPSPDAPPPYMDDRLPSAYSDGQMKVLLERIFAEGIRAYVTLVDRNFPGLKDYFELYRRLPVKVTISYRRPLPTDERWDWGWVAYDLGKGAGDDVSIEVRIAEEGPRGLDLNAHNRRLHGLVAPHNAPGFRGSGRGRGAARLAPIRAFAYGLVEKELRGLTPEHLLGLLH